VPELPEVETVVRGLVPRLSGHRIASVVVHRPDIVDIPVRQFRSRLKDRTVNGVHRRAKYIVIDLDDDSILTVHLGMTGKLLFFEAGQAPQTTHPAVRFRLTAGPMLVYDDVRRFGRIWWGRRSAWAERSARIGPEPLARTFTWHTLFAGLQASRAPTRSWLLDQRRIAGVGNIYANEALFLAGVHPSRPACAVDEPEARALHAGLKRTLSNAIRGGGTTLNDYRDATGAPGRYASRLRVYGRDGDACAVCATAIERTVFAGRSAFFCPACQT